MNVMITSAKGGRKLQDNWGGDRTTRCLKPFILVHSTMAYSPTLTSEITLRLWTQRRYSQPKDLADGRLLSFGEEFRRGL